MHVSIASPCARPSPYSRRIGIHIIPFEACSDFTHVTARWIAQPPKAAFVTRLRPGQSPSQAARQLPDQSTTLWVEYLPPLVMCTFGAHGNTREFGNRSRACAEAIDRRETVVFSERPVRFRMVENRPSQSARDALHWGRGAGWRVRTTFLGAVRSLWELSLPLPVGFGTRRPPTYVGARDHRPTAVSAPRLIPWIRATP